MQYTQQAFNAGVSRFRAKPQEARIPPPPSCSPPRFTPLPPKDKHYVLSEVELATFRTQLCEDSQKNQCVRPDACPHSHCITWQRRNPYEVIYEPQLCPGIEFRRANSKMSLVRNCTRGRTCSYAHSKEEELYHPLMYKTKLCTVFPKCDRHYCPFAHSTEEMRHPFNNPLIHYIWGSTPGLDCTDSNDTVQRWALSPLACLSGPILITENTQLPSIPREAGEDPTQLAQQQLQLQQQQFQLHQQQQQQTAHEGLHQRWTQDSLQMAQRQYGKQLHSVASPAAAPPPPYTFTMEQQQQQQPQSYPLGAAEQTSMRGIKKQALPNYNVARNDLFPSAKPFEGSQMTMQQQSCLSHSSEILQSLKTTGGAESAETREVAGTTRRPAALLQESLLVQPLLAQKPLSTAGIEIHDGIGGSCSSKQQQTLPASSEAASAATTTASTDLQDLLDSESIRGALIMTLAQQLIGPQVNQLSVDQVLIVLDLAVKLAAQLQPTTPSVSVFSPSQAEELLRLQQTEPDSPQQGSSILTNTLTLASSAGASQQGKLRASSSGSSLQSEDLLRQQQQQQRVGEASVSASHATRSAVARADHSATTDNLLAGATSPASFDPQSHGMDPVASLAATHALIEQLRKLSLLEVGEEVSHNCSSPAPSLEEEDTSRLSIARGSSTAVWSPSTSPMVGGGGDLSSRYATMSVRHGDLAPSTAITAAATTFASASSNADEASLCACPSLTIAQDLNAGSDKHPYFLHVSHAGTVAGDSTTERSSGGASAAPFFPSRTQGKVCASPVDGVFREHARLANRGGRGGEMMCSATTHGSTKTTPAYTSLFGSKNASSHLRGLLAPPGAHDVTCNENDAPADTSASCPLHLAGANSARRFSCCGANPVAVAFSPPRQHLKGNFGRSDLFSDLSTVKQQQDTGLQKRAMLTGSLASARKLSDPFSPQLTTCSHSPSAGHFSSPQYCMGGGSSTEPTPAYGMHLPDSNSSNRNNFSHNAKGSYQGGSRSTAHESKNTFSDGQYRQRAKANPSKA